MTDYLFAAPKVQSIPVKGEAAEYPIHRIFCVGRNYAAHAEEMGFEVDREAPFYFSKQLHSVMATGGTLPYPPGTEDFHYEMELVVALGAEVFKGTAEQGAAAVYAYGCGLDMTRRDQQIASRNKKRPWMLGKDVEGSCVLSPLTKAGDFAVDAQRIHLEVNGVSRQDSTLDLLIHKVPEVIAHLSTFYHLRPGDIILTGTPEGVGPVVAGDKITGGIDGLDPIALDIGPAE
ncbi:MAG: fumarylacetoacetate hydrolase family protein [Vannielia sp.]|uniref:fumarylacetoacetate hydrolase family protein n=1 Tax=Vannielia sp. TaxID=2813045 RepID=UPI003B8E6F9F